MEVIKTICETVDIRDCISFMSDIENNLYALLSSQYEMRCKNGYLIKSVIRKFKYGDCIINADGDPTLASMSVQFDVIALVFMPGMIIPRCKIMAQKGLKLAASVDNANVILSDFHMLPYIQVGDTMPAIVRTAQYSFGLSKVNMFCIPLKFNYPAILYEIVVPDSFVINEKTYDLLSKYLNIAVSEFSPLEKKYYDMLNSGNVQLPGATSIIADKHIRFPQSLTKKKAYIYITDTVMIVESFNNDDRVTIISGILPIDALVNSILMLINRKNCARDFAEIYGDNTEDFVRKFTDSS